MLGICPDEVTPLGTQEKAENLEEHLPSEEGFISKEEWGSWEAKKGGYEDRLLQQISSVTPLEDPRERDCVCVCIYACVYM